MPDLNALIENYFAPKKKKIKLSSIQSLMEIMKETHEEFILERETKPTTATNLDNSEEKSIDIKFPKIRISEDFGKIGTGDRATIEKFAANIAGNTIEEKIANLNSILTEANPDASIGQLLSTMVITEILSSIVSDFTESAGGFIFEGFLAGLFGGKSVQIADPKDIEGMDAAGKPITDVILNGKHYSLKLLGQETIVKGSFKNMVNHFKTVDHIIYLDARRIGKDQGLEFGEFTITLENFLDVFITPFLREVAKSEIETIEKPSDFKKKLAQLVKEKKPIKKIKVSGPVPGFGRTNVFDYSQAVPDQLNEKRYTGSDMNKIINMFINMPDDQLQSLAPFGLIYAEQKFEGTKAEKLFGRYSLVEQIKAAIEKENREEILRLLELTPGYGPKPQQFKFTREEAENIANFRSVGKLMIGPEYMKKAYANYANVLRDTLTPVYNNLQLFTDNINDYFLGVGGEDAEQNRKQYAMKAIQNANDLQTSTTRAVEKIEKEG